MLISVTSLSSFDYCARKLFLQEVLEIKEPLNEAMLKGSIRHEALDGISKQEEQIVTSIKQMPTINEILEVYKQQHCQILQNAIMKKTGQLKMFNLSPTTVFEHAWPLIQEETKTRAFNLHNFIKKHRIFGEELWQKLDPKIHSEIRLCSEKLKLKGVIDKVEAYSNNEFIPFELKTGKTPAEGVWPSHKIQLAAYCMLLEEKFSRAINKGYVHYLDENQLRPVVMNPFLKADVVDKTSKIVAMLQSREMPAFCANSNKCEKCSMRALCYNKGKIKEMLQGLN